jgi:hypothetical protein
MTNSELKVLAAKVTSQHKTFKRGISNQTAEEVVSALLLSASQADKIAELEKERDDAIAAYSNCMTGNQIHIRDLEQQAKELQFALENITNPELIYNRLKALKEGK